jgi:apolipoprotein N-acyltransferase
MSDVRVQRVAAAFTNLSGWRRRAALAGLGAVAALALPPFHLLPALLLSFPALVWMWDGSRTRWAAFGAGWWWGLGFYSAGFYWIAHALLIEPEKFGWLIPFGTCGLGGVMGVFTGLATLAAWLPRAGGPGRVALLAGAWTISEWLRTFVMTGFPWNPLGSVWDSSLAVAQAAALVGAHGLALMTALCFGLPAVLADPLPPRLRRAAIAVAAGLPLAAWAWGTARLAGGPAETVPGIRLRLVQPAVEQALKWRDDIRERNFADTIALSREPGFESVTHVIWPETAASFFLDLDDGHRRLITAAAPPGGLVITGAPRITPRGVTPVELWNSLLAIDSSARVVGLYDKAHLVPFGEYVPLRSVLPLSKITPGGIDFSSGPGPRTLTLPGLPPVSPLICYEAIFPGRMVDGNGPVRPQWLLNVTNDGWFGESAGPWQHLAAARARAIEEGLPLVRAANTGISAVFDGMGREIARLDLGRRGVLDAPLPRPPAGLTPFARWGETLPLGLAVAVAAMGWAFRRRT